MKEESQQHLPRQIPFMTGMLGYIKLNQFPYSRKSSVLSSLTGPYEFSGGGQSLQHCQAYCLCKGCDHSWEQQCYQTNLG